MNAIRKAIVLLLCMMLVFCCGCEEEVILPQNHLFTYTLAQEPNNLDPQTANNAAAHTVILNLYEGLCRVDSRGNAQPGVAEKWESNRDHTVFTFRLRADAVWSDETPVTADDFVFAIKRALSAQTRCPTAEELFCIAGAEEYYYGLSDSDYLGVEAVDAHTVRFTLRESFADFPAETAKSAYMPCSQSFFEQSGGKYGLESDAMLTNGPFRLRTRSGWVQGEYVRLVRNEHYRGAQPTSPSGVHFKLEPPADPVQAVVNGERHVVLLPDGAEAAVQAAGLQLVTFAETTFGLLFNCEKTVLTEPLIRQALTSAVTRTALTEFFPLRAELTANVIPDAVTVHGKPYRTLARSCVLPKPTETPKEWLTRGLAALNVQKMPSLTVLCVDTPQNRMIVNQLLTDWRSKLGCYFNIETVADDAALQKRIAAGDYQLALGAVRAPQNDPLDFLNRLTALTRYTSAEYEELAAQVHAEPITASRAIEDLLLTQGVFSPLYMVNTAYALGATVTDLVIHPFGGGIDFRDAGRTA